MVLVASKNLFFTATICVAYLKDFFPCLWAGAISVCDLEDNIVKKGTNHYHILQICGQETERLDFLGKDRIS